MNGQNWKIEREIYHLMVNHLKNWILLSIPVWRIKLYMVSLSLKNWSDRFWPTHLIGTKSEKNMEFPHLFNTGLKFILQIQFVLWVFNALCSIRFSYQLSFPYLTINVSLNWNCLTKLLSYMHIVGIFCKQIWYTVTVPINGAASIQKSLFGPWYYRIKNA